MFATVYFRFIHIPVCTYFPHTHAHIRRSIQGRVPRHTCTAINTGKTVKVTNWRLRDNAQGLRMCLFFPCSPSRYFRCCCLFPEFAMKFFCYMLHKGSTWALSCSIPAPHRFLPHYQELIIQKNQMHLFWRRLSRFRLFLRLSVMMQLFKDRYPESKRKNWSSYKDHGRMRSMIGRKHWYWYTLLASSVCAIILWLVYV